MTSKGIDQRGKYRVRLAVLRYITFEVRANDLQDAKSEAYSKAILDMIARRERGEKDATYDEMKIASVERIG